jgi:hypothetical protein
VLNLNISLSNAPPSPSRKTLAVTLNDHPTKLEKTIIKKSFYCGLLTFAVNFLFVLSKAMSALLIFSNILPGLIYAIVLCDFENNRLDMKRFLFIVFSGGLYIFVAWVATGYSFFSDNTKLCFPIASVIGATLLLTFYYLLIDKDISFSKGLLLASSIGLLSSILPFLGDYLERRINDYDIKGNVNLGFTLLIFPVWQTLFGWTIHKVKKATANMGICKSWADGSRVSTFVFQFGFISGLTLLI